MHECKNDDKINMIYDIVRQNHEDSNKRLDKIDDKIELVLSLKYKIIGGIILSAFLAPFIVSVVSKMGRW